MDIFVSYSREDRARIERVVQLFQSSGYSVWWDSAISPGTRWDVEIERALKNARAVVAFWSRHSVQSAWVREEAEYGRARGVLIPVLLERVEIPLTFRRLHHIDVSDWDGEPSDPVAGRLLDAVKAVMEVETPLRRGEKVSSDDTPINSPLQVENPAEPEHTSRLPKTDVFVAYARKNFEVCQEFAGRMRAEGVQVFYDQFIGSGDRWRDAIVANIEACTVFVVLISHDALKSDYVKREVNLASKRSKHIIPIFIEDVTLGGGLELELDERNYVFAHKDRDQVFSKIIEEAKTIVALSQFENSRGRYSLNTRPDAIKSSSSSTVSKSATSNVSWYMVGAVVAYAMVLTAASIPLLLSVIPQASYAYLASGIVFTFSMAVAAASIILRLTLTCTRRS